MDYTDNLKVIAQMQTDLAHMEKSLTKDLIVRYYDQEIERLDKEFVAKMEVRQKNYPSGSATDTAKYVGENAVMEVEYQQKRDLLVRFRDNVIGVSPQVQTFIDTYDPKRKREPLEYSKFDVDAGTVAVDTSQNPLGGKMV